MAVKYTNYSRETETAKRQRIKKIIVAVVLAHIISMAIPLIWDLINEWMKPKEEIITLNIDGMLGDKNSGGGGNPSGLDQPGTPPPPPKGEPAPKTPKQSKPEQPTPEPPQPEQPKQEKKPTPEKPEQTPIPTPTTKPVKPKPKTLTAEEIKVDKKVVKKVTKKTTAPTPPAPTSNNRVSRDALSKAVSDASHSAGERNGVLNGVSGGQIGGMIGGSITSRKPGPPGPVGPSIGEITVTYGSKLGAYIRPRWDQPSKYDLNNRKPQVTIFLQIAPNGVVMSSGIVTPSGIPAMDRSVQKMLDNLRQVPPPPAGLDTNHFQLILAIED